MSHRLAEKAAGFLLQVEAATSGSEEGVLESFTVRDEPVTGFDRLSSPERQAVEGALEKLTRPAELNLAEQDALEAIIIPDRRPVINIRDDDYEIAEKDWLHLNAPDVRARLRPAIPAIGRLDLPDHPSIPYAGTAFLVGPDVLMTNRHVAELFATGLGRRGLAFRPGLAGTINFAEEDRRKGEIFFRIDEALLIHPWWDMALLRVRDLDPAIRPLTLSRDGGAPGASAPDVVVIGYPAYDPRRNDIDVQRRVFNDLFNVKRLQPGKLLPRRPVASFGNEVEALTHDSSTLGGNSGSAVIDARTGHVVALHFGGRYLQTNYAVPAADLALDSRLVDLGLNFEQADEALASADGGWSGKWRWLEGDAGAVESGAAVAAPAEPLAAAATTATVTVDGATWTVPLVITVRPGVPVAGAASTGAPPAGRADEAFAEKMVEPWHEDGYGRDGYRADFLGPEVPLPEPTDPGSLATLEDGSPVVPYMHFSLAMHRVRRLALFTAANVWDAAEVRKPDPERKYTRAALSGLGGNDVEKWFADPRLRGIDQLPDKFFTKDRAAFDKGHLVRRDDVAWGDTYDELRIANGDTYHVTNCSPQTAGFNRADGVVNWGELERAVLAQGSSQRLSVFAGPVLADDDPWFTGVDAAGAVRVRIPQAYWKVVVAPDGDGLCAFGFLLEQDLAGADMERLDFEPKWASSMRALTDLEARIGRLTFPEVLHAADRHGTRIAEAVLDGIRR